MTEQKGVGLIREIVVEKSHVERRSQLVYNPLKHKLRSQVFPELTQRLKAIFQDALVAKCWSWNGRLFASTTNARVILVKPFQLIQECLDVTR